MIRLVVLLALLISASAHAFTIDLNFDDNDAGGRCEGIAQGRSYVSTEVSASTPNACTFWIKKGTTGWGTWGGTVKLPRNLYGGDELWIRLRVFVPKGFDGSAPGEGNRLKFLRVRTFRNEDHVGYNDIQFNMPGSKHVFGFIYEGVNRWYMDGGPQHLPAFGRWETYEWYLRFASSRKDSMVRFWHNGELILETDERRTLKSPDTYASAVYLGTYWNGGSPKTQKLYIDDLVITSERPAKRDESNNPVIGVGGSPR